MFHPFAFQRNLVYCRADEPVARVHKMASGDFLGKRPSLLSKLFLIYFALPASLHCEKCVYTSIYTYLTAQRLYLSYRCCQTALRVIHFYTCLKRWKMLTGYLSIERRLGGEWANTWHWTKYFTIPTVIRWPKCSKDNRMTIPFPVIGQLQCFF